MTSSPVFILAFAAAIGVGMVILSARIKVPSIALLLLTGIAVGPHGLGILQPDGLGQGLQIVVGMAVAIILFEGGLTLDLDGARRSPRVIRRMLSVGVLITWLGTAATVWWLLDLGRGLSLLCGSLVIVTGPTVISPLLRRIGVRERLKHILYWEAVLVDAIGVFIAVLCLEWLNPEAGLLGWDPLLRFGARLAVGGAVGVAAGGLMGLTLRHHLVPDEQVNIFVLTAALLTYAACEAILHEAGILAVIIAGLVVSVTKPAYITELKRFKLELTELAIGMLFVLLAARLDLRAYLDYGWELVAAVAVMVFVLRPLVILTATVGQRVSLQEKLFLSWIAPRGIVAAFMASLFSLQLSSHPQLAAQAPFLETFTFAVIGTTVMLQGFTAPWVAKTLGLTAEKPRTWLIVGDVSVASALVEALQRAGGQALALAPIDQAEEARQSTNHVIQADPLDRGLLDDPRFADVGHVLSVAANAAFDQLVCERWSEVVGADECYQAALTVTDGGDAIDEQHVVGTEVWHHAPSPAEMLHGIEAGRLVIDVVELEAGAEPGRFGEHMVPLFWVGDDGVVSLRLLHEPDISLVDGISQYLSNVTHFAPSGPGIAVVVRRRVPGLAGLVESAIVVDDPMADFDQVVESLLDQAAEFEPSLDLSALKESIIERERSMPTAMGSGVAIPHAYCPEMSGSKCFVANVPHGLTPAQPGGDPVRLVFLVLSPVGRAEDHLRSLAALAQLVHDRDYAELLERQRTNDALMDRIHERA
ncbi:cation:proton antiporter [Haliangium sp.]|uniref:cation:proton antiporter domain-containing protein n=1 Tax=Haliangium sp. TaxID=2663208 RepID=UPI003D0BF20D